MNKTQNRMLVVPLQEHWHTRRYALCVAAVGYEQRARHISQQFQIQSDRRLALAFDHQHEHEYASNLEFYKSSGFDVYVCDDHEYRIRVEAAFLDVARSSSEHKRVLVDISSRPRHRRELCYRVYLRLFASVVLDASVSRFDAYQFSCGACYACLCRLVGGA
jgi:hypothetical protein